MSKTVNATAVKSIITHRFGANLEAVRAELTAWGFEPKERTIEESAAILTMRVGSMDEFTSLMVNLSEGAITSDELYPMLVEAFPNHRVGDRHPGNYLSLCRTGHVKGQIPPRFAPAKETRKGATPKVVTFDLTNVEATKLKALMKASLGTPLQAIVQAEVTRRHDEAANEAAQG